MTTVPETLHFLRGQLAEMMTAGFAVTVISSPGDDLGAFAQLEGVDSVPVSIARAITPFQDVRTIVTLVRTLRARRTDILHAHTPKAGLLGMIAGTIARVPHRIYHVHGLPFMTARGVQRVLLRLSERVAGILAHQVFCVSPSLRAECVQEGLFPAAKVASIASGSVNGVDAELRFNPARVDSHAVAATRRELELPPNAPAIGFVGRLVCDKGTEELWAAWKVVRDISPEWYLLLVGPVERRDTVSAATLREMQADPRVRLVGEVRDPERYYPVIDILAFPTHREGFGVVAIEAAAMEIPVVGTDIVGCRDAVADGETGILVPPRDSRALADALLEYILNPVLRTQHGKAGRARALREFQPTAIWNALASHYAAAVAEPS